ncbi:MAG TPA: AgmX/PglI C-terminal domain-containing protein [Kofleriaceae bacterium]|nr:AgmX/PglI C-terminal domain-containing protein [Kofleriaceae bacterium]
MSSSKLALSFRLFHNGQLIREETLTQSVIKIGKVPSAHLQIADEAVSRMHAIIEVTGRDVSLIDLGSTRGSYVNDHKVHKARLASGDVITLGDTRIELAIRDPDRPPPPPAAARRAASPAVVSGVIETASEAAVDAAPAPPAAVPPPVAVVAPAPVVPPAAVVAAVPTAVPEVSPLVPAAGDEPGAAAVEIAAMLGDSVVGVKHCIDPHGGKVAPATWGLVAAGVACLVASVIAFGTSVATAADNQARLEAWTRVHHRPAYAFRPARLGPAVDWVAFGGFGLAIVGLGLGIARMRRERVSPYYRIGTAPGVELAIEGAPAPAFPLVAPSGDDFVFQFAPGIDGELLQGGSATPLAALAAAGRARPSASIPGAFELAIPRHARIRARAGRATFQIVSVARPRRHATPLTAGLERRTLVYVAGSLTAHLAIWGLLQLVPPEAIAAPVEPPPILEAVANRYQVISPEDAVLSPSEDPGAGGGDPGGPQMALPSGASGDPAATRRGQLQVADAELPPVMSRADAIRNAREAGPFGSEQLISAIDDLAEHSGLASGFDTTTVDGPLVGDYGAGRGSFGTGRSGRELGGGCTDGPCGLIPGGARYLTINDGPGAGGNYGLPGRDFRRHEHQPLLPTIGTPQVVCCGYDKAIIRRYIRRSIDRIAYCYDRQLLAHPGIEGEVAIRFFIAPTGVVERASGTGFDPEVARCVADVIQTIAFPRPGDKVGVEVNYPFAFHTASR